MKDGSRTNCPGDGVIPLMAVVQEKNDKVRPVLDFLEFNKFVECNGVDADVCEEKLRSWKLNVFGDKTKCRTVLCWTCVMSICK